MGTNFYLLSFEGSDHIGKRSAAGLYCWDCSRTLCSGRVHSGAPFYEKCLKCGKFPEKEDLWDTTGARELGFNKNAPKRKTGVKSASSFSWAIKPDDFFVLKKEFKIEDEYGRAYTEAEFEQMLEECPIRFYDSIGTEFC